MGAQTFHDMRGLRFIGTSDAYVWSSLSAFSDGVDVTESVSPNISSSNSSIFFFFVAGGPEGNELY